MKIILSTLLIVAGFVSRSQTNTFPSSGSVGIGITTPSTKLHVVGSGGTNIDALVSGRIQTGDGGGVGGIWLNSGQSLFLGQFNTTNIGFFNNGQWPMVIDNSGRVGIGTTTPSTKLHVVGSGGSTVDALVNGRIQTGDGGGVGGIWLNSTQSLFVGQFNTTNIGFYNNGQWPMVIDNGGRVGIGTSTPSASDKLTVAGNIYGRRVRVDVSAGADYVFEEGYSLRSLDQVKSYIEENKHLPDVPSAKEMEEKGMDVAEMNVLLLKKMEELTLYVIELKEENKSMNAEIKALKNK